MVLLKFADGSKNDIPLEELQKIPFFKNLPTLKDNYQELDLSTVNENFTYNNLVKCIAFSQEKVDNSCYDLVDFLGLDFNFYSKNTIINIGEYFNLDDAIKNKNYEDIIVKCLIDNGYFLNNYIKLSKLPLNIIKHCITKNNIKYTQGLNGTSLLTRGCRFGHKEIIEILIKIGADLNIKSYNGHTALSIACLYGYKNIVKFLINSGAIINLESLNHVKKFYLKR